MQQQSLQLFFFTLVVILCCILVIPILLSLILFSYRLGCRLARKILGVQPPKSKPKTKKIPFSPGKVLQRVEHNPILMPEPHNDWEAGGTFNPAAWHDDQGTAHLLYRAVGADGVSRLGYARSKDGIHFERLPYPVYSMENLRSIGKDGRVHELRFDPVMYPSGGSYGGAEDPRMVCIDDRIYVSCSAFDGWDFIRIAVFSISKDDFINQKWRWSKLMLLSPEGQINKNWVLFPEKINGQFAILHSLTPSIQVEYVSELEDVGHGRVKVNSKFNAFEARKERPGWDTWLRGVGAPPIKTDAGWLVFYHAIDKTEPHKYKLGAFILDYKNPTKILAKSPEPVLVPDMWYENDSKPGVVYACGAVLQDEKIFVYYGGGDRYACVAEVDAKELIDWLVTHGKNGAGTIISKK